MITRRSLIRNAICAPMLLGGRAYATSAARDSRLLVVFLRGAYDAANIIIPTSSDFYHEARPTLALSRPDPANPDAPLPLDADWVCTLRLKTAFCLCGRRARLPSSPLPEPMI
jgi:uncharacterized protein (DUF1501 family)